MPTCPAAQCLRAHWQRQSACVLSGGRPLAGAQMRRGARMTAPLRRPLQHAAWGAAWGRYLPARQYRGHGGLALAGWAAPLLGMPARGKALASGLAPLAGCPDPARAPACAGPPAANVRRRDSAAPSEAAGARSAPARRRWNWKVTAPRLQVAGCPGPAAEPRLRRRCGMAGPAARARSAGTTSCGP